MNRLTRLLGGAVIASMLLVLAPTWEAQAVRVPETLSHRSPATAGPVVPGFPIDHVGVLWDDPGHRSDAHASHGAVRFRHDGVWGKWIPLIKDGAPGNGLWASGLVAGDGAQAYQVRGIPVGAGSPRTVAFNTSDGPLRTTGVRVGGAAAIPRCQSRAEWGADESLRERVSPDFAPAQVMTLHHTATSNNDDDPAGTVRAIYAYHTVDNGWRDIGYHYLISEDGTVFEGRWSGELGKTSDDDTYSQACATGGTGADFAHESTDDAAALAIGAHAGGYNTGNVGVALLGSFTTAGRYSGEPTQSAVAAAEGVLAEFAGRHGIDPLGTVDYQNSVNTKLGVDTVSGHRDYNATECPGDNLYIQLPQIRSTVATLLDPVGDTPPSVSITSPADASTVDGLVTVSAEASDDVAVSSLTFAVDGGEIAVDSNSSDGWSALWDTTTVTDGAHSISAVATDSAGQTALADISVVVANGAPETMHVADLDGVAASKRRFWKAEVTIEVQNSRGAPVPGAAVTGVLDGDSAQCTTGDDGTCTVSSAKIPLDTDTIMFTVSDVSGSLLYVAGDNADPDADDSDGTSITVSRI